MKVSRQVLACGLCLLLLTMVASDTSASPLAGFSERIDRYGTTHAVSRKRVDNLSQNFIAGVRSYTTNPVTNIGVIGWSWWTVRETCSGAIRNQVEYTGSVRYNASDHTRLETFPKHYCGGTREGWSLGNHDFHQFGYEKFFPYHQHREAIP